MNDPKDDLANDIRIFLEEKGIDPFYTVTIVVIIVALSYHKELRDWEKVEGWRKGIIISAVFVAVILSIMSLLRLVGVMQF